METGYEEFVSGAAAAPIGASTRSKSSGGSRQRLRDKQQQQFDKLQAKLAKLAKHKKLAAKTGPGAGAATASSGSAASPAKTKKKKQQKADRGAAAASTSAADQQPVNLSKRQQKQLKERQSAGAAAAAAAAAYQNDDTLYDYGPETQAYLRMQSGAAQASSAAAKERKQPKPAKLSKAKARQQLESGLGFVQQLQTPQQQQQQTQALHHHHHQHHHQQQQLAHQQQQLYPSEQRKACAMNATHLKNMLKLPKAHRWVFYEWFYSNLDRPLFLGPNDFQNCLRETFPLLRTRRLTRAHWSLIRKLLGKPRRCSPAFFAEERRALHERRDKIRSLQRRRSLKEGETVRELPDDLRVPMPLIIGTRVVARVRYPTDGLYAGLVDAIDGYNHCYRVTFDKQPLGTRSIPDYEVRSVAEQESIPLASYKANHQPSRALFTPARLLAQSSGSASHRGGDRGGDGGGSDIGSGTPGGVVGKSSAGLGGGGGTGTELSPLVAASVSRSAQMLGLNEEDSFSGYALRFLLVVTRLMKMVERKKRCLDDLCRLNDQAELLVTAARPASLQLVHDYSACLLGLRRLNADLRPHLASAVQLAGELGHERGLPLDPSVELKAKASELAVAAIGRAETRLPGGPLRNLKSTDLTTQLVALLALLRRVAERRPEEQDYAPVRSLLAEVKASLHSGNVSFFENNVEVHLQAVLARLDDGSPLHPFHLRASSNYF